jgi:hypothetical protein
MIKEITLSTGEKINGVYADKSMLSTMFEKRMSDDERFTQEEVDEGKSYFSKLRDEIKNKKFDAFSSINRDMNLIFCTFVLEGKIPQFVARADLFKMKFFDISNRCQIYKFKNDFVKLLVEKASGDFGYRNMPFNDIFIDCYLEFNGYSVFGITLKYCRVNSEGQMIYADDFDFNDYPEFDNEGVSIFITGLDTSNTSFYSLTTLDKFTTLHNNDTSVGWACPFCNQIMSSISRSEIACINPHCVKGFQGNKIYIYDISDVETLKWLGIMNIADLRFIEDKIRVFVSNFLDFITNPEVRIHNLLSEEDRERRNRKRKIESKQLIPQIKIINVDGFLDKYLTKIKNHFGTYARAKSETWVSGHYIRFWMRDYWHHIYDIIKGLKTDEEIITKLKKYKRKDKDGHILPLSMQYQWDSSLKVIKVWKMGFVVNEGKKKGRSKVFVVDSGDKN